MIILSRLRTARRLTVVALAYSAQKPEAQVRAVLEKLVETGFLEPYGTGRGRSYTLPQVRQLTPFSPDISLFLFKFFTTTVIILFLELFRNIQIKLF